MVVTVLHFAVCCLVQARWKGIRSAACWYQQDESIRITLARPSKLMYLTYLREKS
jgi:hypothetical protein